MAIRAELMAAKLTPQRREVIRALNSREWRRAINFSGSCARRMLDDPIYSPLLECKTVSHSEKYWALTSAGEGVKAFLPSDT